MISDKELLRRNQQAALQALAAEGINTKVSHARLNKFIAILDPAPAKPAGRILEQNLQAYLDHAGFWTTVVVNGGIAKFFFFDESTRASSAESAGQDRDHERWHVSVTASNWQQDGEYRFSSATLHCDYDNIYATGKEEAEQKARAQLLSELSKRGQPCNDIEIIATPWRDWCAIREIAQAART